MEYQDFCIKLKNAVEQEGRGRFNVRLMTVNKNNGVTLQGLSITMNGSNISPTIYLEHFFKEYTEGRGMRDILDGIIGIVEAGNPVQFEINDFCDYKMASEHIAFRIINTQMNRDFLEKVPHIEWNDLSLIFFYTFNTGGEEQYSVVVYNSHLKMWKIDRDTLYRDACRNTPRLFPDTLKNMQEILEQIYRRTKAGGCASGMELLIPDEPLNMYVLSNKSGLYGATAMLYSERIRDLARINECGIYILPSSIHELILVPESQMDDSTYLRQMVTEVNLTELSRGEILSYSIYYYDPHMDEIRIL